MAAGRTHGPGLVNKRNDESSTGEDRYPAAARPGTGPRITWKRLIPCLVLLAGLVGFFALRAAYLRVSQAAEAGEVHWSGLTTPASFVIGSVASYWMITRIAGFWA